MNQLRLLFDLQKGILTNQMNTWRQHSLLKIVVVSLFAVVFFVAIFAMFYRGLRFFEFYIPRDFFELMLEYLFSLLYFSLLLMLTFSSTIIAFSVFFHAQETSYLVTCPLSPAAIFFYKLSETIAFASWAVLFLGVPVCFAYAIQQRLGLDFYPLLVLLYAPFVTIPCILGALIAFLLTLYLTRYRRVIGIIVIILTVAGLMLLGTAIASLKKEATPFSAAWFFGMLDYLNFARNPLLPSTWMSRAMLNLAYRDYGGFLFHFGLLLSTTLFLGAIGYIIATASYRQAWSIYHTNKARKTFWRFRWLSTLLRSLFFLKPQDRFFLEKDIKIFFRDPLQWSQFAILLGLLLIYILNLRTLKYDQQVIFWKHVVATLNLCATSLTMCTFASRFIFPLLSLEGRRFWMLGVMPIKRSGILIAKFLFAMVTLLITSEVLILLSCYMLQLPWALTLVHCVTVFAITAGVAGISVGLGAIYPNFREDSPAKIVSGFGGTLNLVLSLLFILVIVAIQFLPSHLVLKRAATSEHLVMAIVAGSLITMTACLLPLFIGIRCFNRIEI